MRKRLLTASKPGVYKGSAMPWGAFSRINELELKAIFRYLKSLPPTKNKIEKTVYPPGEVVPAG